MSSSALLDYTNRHDDIMRLSTQIARESVDAPLSAIPKSSSLSLHNKKTGNLAHISSQPRLGVLDE
jgi:hypothetical protein